jgi:hypothetical protein
MHQQSIQSLVTLYQQYVANTMHNFSLPRIDAMQRVRLACLLLLCLESLLPVAPYHDDREEAANDGSTEDYEDDGYANGPDAGREKGVERVVIVNEGLE